MRKISKWEKKVIDNLHKSASNNSIKLWLDDDDESKRPMPQGYTRATSFNEAVALCKSNVVTHLDLDHDLGTESPDSQIIAKTGEDFLKWYIGEVKKGNFTVPEYINIHSKNNAGKQNMLRLVDDMKNWIAQGSKPETITNWAEWAASQEKENE